TVATETNNDGAYVAYRTQTTTTALRVVVKAGAANPMLADVRVVGEVLLAGPSFVDASVADGRHTYRLRAINASGECVAESAAVELTVPVGDLIAPPAPISLTAEADFDFVTLRWTSTSADAVSYNVYRNRGAGWLPAFSAGGNPVGEHV